MAQRSEGIFPREKFDLDASLEVPYPVTGVSPIPLDSVNTWKIVVLGATNLGEGGEGGYVQVCVGGEITDFYAEDIDANGVGVAYLRGSSITEGQDYIWVDYLNGASADAVYLDAVDNVG